MRGVGGGRLVSCPVVDGSASHRHCDVKWSLWTTGDVRPCLSNCLYMQLRVRSDHSDVFVKDSQKLTFAL